LEVFCVGPDNPVLEIPQSSSNTTEELTTLLDRPSINKHEHHDKPTTLEKN